MQQSPAFAQHPAPKKPSGALRVVSIVLIVASLVPFAHAIDRYRVFAMMERNTTLHLEKAEQHRKKGDDKEADQQRRYGVLTGKQAEELRGSMLTGFGAGAAVLLGGVVLFAIDRANRKKSAEARPQQQSPTYPQAPGAYHPGYAPPPQGGHPQWPHGPAPR